MFKFEKYELQCPDKYQQEVIVQSIWKQYCEDIREWSVWVEYHSQSTSKHRKLFNKALEPLITNTSNPNCQNIFDNISYWAEHIRSFSYRSLPTAEQDFYNHIFMALNNEYPQITHEWLTPQEIQDQYGFSKSWQSKQRMASSGSTLPFHKIGGNFIRYKRSEIDAWIEEHKVR